MSYKENDTNIGKKWSPDEIGDLKTELSTSIPLSEIARSHKRSERAIQLYGLTLAYRETKDTDLTDESGMIYGFSYRDIKDYVESEHRRKEHSEIKRKELRQTKLEEKRKIGANIPTTPSSQENDSSLNEEQKLVFDKATTTTESIFLTGSPGTGKSYTLKKIVSHFQRRYTKVGITSTTGCSAILIGARTLHSFLKLDVSDKTPEQLRFNLQRYPKVLATLSKLEILIIEEVSMLSDTLFTTISKYLSLIRKDPRPFGGIQLLLVGDFCQLPPVTDTFCFLSEEWARLSPTVLHLKTLVRQDGDTPFQHILERARTETITHEDIAILKACTKEPGIDYTYLCAKNKEADHINKQEFEKLKGQQTLSTFEYCNSINKKTTLELCTGCKVMVNWNVDIDAHIINGTTGVVVSLDAKRVTIQLTHSNRLYKLKHICIKDENTGMTLATVMPLQLAWAITIHKSQGATLDYLLTDLGSTIFAFGQAYVALSRVKTLKNLALIDIKKESFKLNPHVKAFYDAHCTPAPSPPSSFSEEASLSPLSPPS
jgi:ATP-dependent DNA helicase PIF1